LKDQGEAPSSDGFIYCNSNSEYKYQRSVTASQHEIYNKIKPAGFVLESQE